MSYKVIIADDEVMICEGIARVIPWSEMGLELTMSVYDGQMLSEALIAAEPDIVIIDIEMPFKNGIEVIRDYVDSRKKTQFIIVSAYNEFEYAQAAMTYGIREYLLKPISKKELIKALNNCIRRLREEESAEQLQGMLQENESMVVATLRAEMMRDLLRGHGHEKEAVYQYCGMEAIEERECRLIVLMNEQDDQEIYNPVEFKELCELFLAKAGVECSMMADDLCVVIVRELNLEKIHQFIDVLKDKYRRLFAGEVFTAIGAVCRIGDIRGEFLKLRDVCKNSVEYRPGDTVLVAGRAGLANRDQLRLEEYEDIVMDIRLRNEEQIAARIREMTTQMRRLEWNDFSIRMVCMEYCLRIYSKCGVDRNQDMTSVIGRLQNAGSLEELEQEMTTFFLRIFEKDSHAGSMKNDPIVEKIKEIVEQKYMDDTLCIRKMANTELYLSPDYIGKIFKKKMSMSITRYIACVRVEKAKELLNQGKYKIFEVAYLCGFGYNSQYFSQIFKKFTGMMPSEYGERTQV